MEVKELGWKILCDQTEWEILVGGMEDTDFASIRYGYDHNPILLDKSDCEMLLEFIPKIMAARGWESKE